MFSLKTKTPALVVGGLLGIGVLAYGFLSMQSRFDKRISELESELQTVRGQNTAKIEQLSSDLAFVAEKMDITENDLTQARKLAETLKQEQMETAERMRHELESNTKAMTQLREDAATRLDEVQNDAASKIGAVTGEVQTVRTDLAATRIDLVTSRTEMAAVRDALGRQIARNSLELTELRRRGEREYVEFDLRKAKDLERIGEIRLQLRKTDAKKQKFDIVLLVDDNPVEKKGRIANEPVTFLVGRDRRRYELVVNQVDKDRIRGYISMPKDKVMTAEGQAIRQQQ